LYNITIQNKQQKIIQIENYWYYLSEKNDNQAVFVICTNCKSESEAELFATQRSVVNNDINKTLIKNLAKGMYEDDSQSIIRRDYYRQSCNALTMRINRNYVKKIIEDFGNEHLEDLTERKVIQHLAKIKRSESWKNSYLAVLKDIYKEASWQDINISMPTYHSFKRKSKKADILTKEELSMLFQEKNFLNEEVFLFYSVCYAAGLRTGECRGLRVKQLIKSKSALVIDGYIRESGRVNYNKKGSDEKPKFRAVFLPKKLIRKLEQLIQIHQYQENDYIFQFNGSPYHKNFVLKHFYEAIEISGIKRGQRKITPHSLRFTFVTQMRMKLPKDIVQMFVGHSSAEMTEYYTRADLVDSIDELSYTIPTIEECFSNVF
jgi:integrase